MEDKEKMKRKIYEKFGNDVTYMIGFWAKASCLNVNIDCFHPESFLIGILEMGKNNVSSTLIDYGVNLEKSLKKLKEKLKEKIPLTTPKVVDWENIKISKKVSDICYKAYDLSNKHNHEKINLSHIFIATVILNEDLGLIFFDGISKEVTGECLESILKESQSKKEVQPAPNTPEKKGEVKESVQKKKTELKNSALDVYCTNITDLARINKFDPIISRDAEIDEAITILCRRNKSNPILIGHPGVGKSAVVEGLCQRIVNNSVPRKLIDAKVYSLNIASVVAGTKYRGEFEERMTNIIKEAEKDEKCILFIDEIHMILGAGSSNNGSMDAANIIKPASARGLKCIGATTHDEYKRVFCEDGALTRRFAPVTIEEPTETQTKAILFGLKEKLESYHSCIISEEAIITTIALTKRYKHDKFFPDKAIDCLDTACAKCSWGKGDKKETITANDIATVISKQCSIPLEIIMWDSYERIKHTQTLLSEKIVGQESAINSICRVLKNAYSGIRNPNKPIGIMLFGGPSGTGKTHSAKQLANTMFGFESSLIRIDMTEYSESHTISKIIGSPPGYVGFKDTETLVDKIKRKPYCVLLLDEIEKSHPSIMKLFLQVMSDGLLTSSSGEKINCKNLIIIMTGNFGMNEVKKKSLGFGSEYISAQENNENEKERLIDYCKNMWGLEFVNRVDDFVVFNNLTEENLITVANMKLQEFSERINNPNIIVKFSENVADYLIKNIKESNSNAMAIERIITKTIEPAIVDALLSSKTKNESKRTFIVNAKDKDTIEVEESFK